MILFGGALGLLALGVWIFCIIDAITTPADQVRRLPKLAWIAIVVLLLDIGSLAWLIAGRPWNARATTPRGADRPSGFAGFGTSATAARRAPSRPLSPDDDDEFLASLSKRNQEQRKPGDDRDDRGGPDGEGPQPIG